MTDEERQTRMALAQTGEQWIALYKDVFGKEPEMSGLNWGEYPIDKIIDAIEVKKPFKDETLPKGADA